MFSQESQADPKKSRQSVDAERIIVSFGGSNLKNLSNPVPGWSNRLVFTCKLDVRLFSVFCCVLTLDIHASGPLASGLLELGWPVSHVQFLRVAF